ncbi:carboxypeptidase-like regulatory domain-containing protein [Maribacter chungangensis]|uniref:Carboxypeptidase-like regulatory domain-containing protein n=1 Tax=Maribacter chungangensis TaxID=1069117 RepID=A0ABW3AYR2_9FLAO
MHKKIIFAGLICFVLSTLNTEAQRLSSRILDSITQQPIPYVTVQLKNKGVITNEEGQFTFQLDESIQATDSLLISSMGYESLGKPISEFTEKIIYLSPKAIELREVVVSNKNYTADEIMEFVEDNLEKNYSNSLTKKRVFHRQSSFDRWIKSDFTVKKSTIDVLDQRLLDSVIASVPKYDHYYSEILGDLYKGSQTDSTKLDLLKASKLYDKSTELDAEKLEEQFNDILRKNVKDGSYFKIKSGLLSFKIDADEVSELFEEEIDSTDTAALNKELEEKKKDKEEEKKNYVRWKRNSLARIFKGLPTAEDTDLNFISKSRKYKYYLKEFTFLGDDAVYVIDFKSKGSADYEGTLYINADDFAVLQVNYENTKPLRKFSLLGVSLNNYLAKGKIIYGKGANGFYGLRYYESESANRVGIKRSLKIIEKNKIVKGRNKQNELSGRMDFAFNNRVKNEVVVFETEDISEAAFAAFKENNTVLPTYMANYDPEFWNGYAILEPNTAIKQFASTGDKGE